MRYLFIACIPLLLSFNVSGDMTIPKGRVVCQSEQAIKIFMAKKNSSHKKAALPDDCRQLKNKRRGEVKGYGKGYLKIETKIGDTVYVDKTAVTRN